MFKVENAEIIGWDVAIRSVRNHLGIEGNSDSYWTYIEDAETLQTAKFEHFLGGNDFVLLAQNKPFLEYIQVTADITASLDWWSEFYSVFEGEEVLAKIPDMNKKITALFNYKNLREVVELSKHRKRCKDEWAEFRKWVESLRHSELITA